MNDICVFPVSATGILGKRKSENPTVVEPITIRIRILVVCAVFVQSPTSLLSVAQW